MKLLDDREGYQRWILALVEGIRLIENKIFLFNGIDDPIYMENLRARLENIEAQIHDALNLPIGEKK